MAIWQLVALRMNTGDRIRIAAQVVGGLNALSEKAGVPRRTLGDWVSGSREPKASSIAEIAQATGFSADWLLGIDQAHVVAQDIPQIKAEVTEDDGQRVVAIPNLLTHAGMGNGGLEHIEVDSNGRPLDLFTDGAWSFPTGIATGFHRFKGIYALEVEGDSMEPTYMGGATVFVDTRRQDPKAPGCFIVDYGYGLMLKRVELIGGTDLMAVISDNREIYRSYEFPREQVTIWGRVIAKWEWVK